MLPYLVVPGIIYPKIKCLGELYHTEIVVRRVKKTACLKWMYGFFGDVCKVATLSDFISYPTVMGIIMLRLKSKGQSKLLQS